MSQYTLCPNGHGGPNVLQQMGRSENDHLQVRCTECNEVFEVDDSDPDHPRVEATAEGGN